MYILRTFYKMIGLMMNKDELEKMKKRSQGGNNACAVKCKVDNVIFDCIKDIKEMYNFSYGKITRRLNSDEYKTWIRL